MSLVNEARAHELKRTKTEAEQSIAYEVLRAMNDYELDVIAAGQVVARSYGLPLSTVLTLHERHFEWAGQHWIARHPL